VIGYPFGIDYSEPNEPRETPPAPRPTPEMVQKEPTPIVESGNFRTCYTCDCHLVYDTNGNNAAMGGPRYSPADQRLYKNGAKGHAYVLALCVSCARYWFT